ncbi:MAG: 3'-5' exonuclease [Candidatus Paceibacterota bacterium]
MNLKDRLIALTDLETTGDIFTTHEILEIGLVLFRQDNFEIVDTFEMKVKPEHPEIFVPAALERNGYDEENWKDSIPLKDAMEIYSKKTKDAIFCSYNVSFDWGFMCESFKKTGVKDNMDYHRIDVMSMAFYKYIDKIESLSMSKVSQLSGIEPEEMPHRALNGAMQGYKLYKALLEK